MARRKGGPLGIYLLIPLITAILAWAFLTIELSWDPYLAWIVSLSAATLIIYIYDKVKAKTGGGRVPEVTLHLLSLLGGFIGAWIGLLIIRHKVRKRSFWAIIMFATLLHLAIAGLIFI